MKEAARRRLDAALGIVGRTFITAGLLLLGLVVYQLWGTGLEQRRAQDRLRDDFTELITARPTASTTDTPSPEPIDVPRRPNSALALLEIPTASVADIVVDSATVSALRHGPGHIRGTALPGESGNSAIAGHRTTYGAPFAQLDKVAIGDEIRVTTLRGRFTYTVSDVMIVGPNRTDLLRPKENRTLLTLVTCHPRWSTAKRLIVVADLASTEPLAPTSTTGSTTTTPTMPTTTTTVAPVNEAPPDEATSEELSNELAELDGWFSDGGAILPSILLGLLLIAIAFGANRLRRVLRSRGRRDSIARLVSWSAAAVPFLVVLFYWYHFINMLLPAST